METLLYASNRRLLQNGRASDAWWMGLAGALVAVAYIVVTGMQGLGEEAVIATHLARGHGFSSPFDVSPLAAPSAFASPLYPLIMAGVYQIFGVESVLSLRIMLGLNVASAGAVAAGAYILAARIFGRHAALWGALALILHPVFGRRATAFWDTFPALAMFVWLCVFCTRERARASKGIWLMVALGVGFGLLTLMRVTYVLTFPLLVAMCLGGMPAKRWIMLAAICFAAFIATLTPWTFRNYQVFHRNFFVRDNFPLEIWLGNQEGSYGEMNMDGHPFNNPVEHDLLIAMGEPAYFDLCWSRFQERLHVAPGAFARNTGARFICLFVNLSDGASHPQLRLLIDWLVGTLGMSGFWLALRLRYRVWWLMGTGVLAALPYMASQVNVGYVMWFRFVLMIFAGFLFASLVHWLRFRAWPSPGDFFRPAIDGILTPMATGVSA